MPNLFGFEALSRIAPRDLYRFVMDCERHIAVSHIKKWEKTEPGWGFKKVVFINHLQIC